MAAASPSARAGASPCSQFWVQKAAFAGLGGRNNCKAILAPSRCCFPTRVSLREEPVLIKKGQPGNGSRKRMAALPAVRLDLRSGRKGCKQGETPGQQGSPDRLTRSKHPRRRSRGTPYSSEFWLAAVTAEPRKLISDAVLCEPPSNGQRPSR